MSKNKPHPDAEALERAKREQELARQRFTTTLHTLQYRLKPGTLANDAWTGVKDKTGTMTDSALQTVKDRRLTVSGVIAAIVIFLARDSLWTAISKLIRGEDDSDLVKTKIHKKDENYDLAAPTVSRSVKEGVSA
ncbi:MAG TPA: DUF3618 domain-containing protein [Allosphingosinicella sp.]|uniref:DUF3618 domain-containing protein n=1 Tax=Allosphingosinicella sp. TaxID=2823234 RepID=UPI002ED864F9